MSPTLQLSLSLEKELQSGPQAFSSLLSNVFFMVSSNLFLLISDSGLRPNMNQNFSEFKSFTAKYFPNSLRLKYIQSVHHFIIGAIRQVIIQKLIEINTSFQLIVHLFIHLTQKFRAQLFVDFPTKLLKSLQSQAMSEVIESDLFI